MQQLARSPKTENDNSNFISLPTNIVTLIENIENPTTQRFPGRLVSVVENVASYQTFLQVTSSSPQKFQEVYEDNYDDYDGVVTATPRSFNVRRKGQGQRSGGRGNQVL